MRLSANPVSKSDDAILAAFNVTKDGARIVSICCDVVLYTGVDLTAVPEGVLHIYERFLSTCRADRLRWYATENMTRHKPATPRVLEMLPGWLKPDAPPRKVVNIHLTDSQRFDDAPEFSFWLYGKEPGDLKYGVHANVIRCTFPARWGLENPEGLLEFATDAAAHFPFMSGHSGLVLETSPYQRGPGHVAAWRLSMQHPGLDISNPVTDPVVLRRDGIKGVNWLTAVGRQFTGQLGGADALLGKLPNSVRVLSVGDGLILQAGPAPRWGHVNRNDLLPEYRAVYEVVEPLQEPIVERYTSFSLPGGDHKEKTTRWLRRFANVS